MTQKLVFTFLMVAILFPLKGFSQGSVSADPYKLYKIEYRNRHTDRECMIIKYLSTNENDKLCWAAKQEAIELDAEEYASNNSGDLDPVTQDDIKVTGRWNPDGTLNWKYSCYPEK